MEAVTAGSRRSYWIAWAWIGVVALAVALGKAAGIGPIAWLETWFAVRTGSLLSANILFVILILIGPALWVLMDSADGSEAAVGGGRVRGLRNSRRTAAFLFAGAGVALATALVATILAAGLPDGSEAAAPLTAAELTGGAPPEGRAAIVGAPIEAARAAFDEPSRHSSRRRAYIGFAPGAKRAQTQAMTDGAGPIALFVERSEGGRPALVRELLPQQETAEGYLVVDGLPPHARIALEQAGVRIASPHYLLRDSERLRDDHQIVVLLGLIFCAILAFVGAMVLLIGRQGEPER